MLDWNTGKFSILFRELGTEDDSIPIAKDLDHTDLGLMPKLAHDFIKKKMEEEKMAAKSDAKPVWEKMLNIDAWVFENRESNCSLGRSVNVWKYQSEVNERVRYEITESRNFWYFGKKMESLYSLYEIEKTNGCGVCSEIIMSCKEIDPLIAYAARLEKDRFEEKKKENDRESALECIITYMKDADNWKKIGPGLFRFYVDDIHRFEFLITTQVNTCGNLDTSYGIAFFSDYQDNGSLHRALINNDDYPPRCLFDVAVREYEKLLRSWYEKGEIFHD